MVFQPEIIVRTRKNTSTFSVATRAVTTIGSLPMEAGKGVLHGVGNIFKSALPPHHEVPSPPPVQSTGSSAGSGVKAARSVESLTPVVAPSEPGSLRVVVLSGKDLQAHDAKPYVVIRVGDKEQKTKHGHHKTSTPEWQVTISLPVFAKSQAYRNESFTFAATAFTAKLYIWVYDHKTLGKDKVLGEGEIEVRVAPLLEEVFPRLIHLHTDLASCPAWSVLSC